MQEGYTPEQDSLYGQLVKIKSFKVDDERETRVGTFMSWCKLKRSAICH